MKKQIISQGNADGIILPFTLNGKIVYAKDILNRKGFLAFDNTSITFIDYTSMEKINIEVPETVEEIHKYMADVDYFIQRISLNETLDIKGLGEIKTSEVLKILISFAKTFEKNLHNIEGIKNGYIS